MSTRGYGQPLRDAVRAAKWWPTDVVVWVLAVFIAVWARFDFDTALVDVRSTVVFAVGAAVLQTLIGIIVGVYVARFVPGSFDEAVALVACGAGVGTSLLVWAVWLDPSVVPRSTPVSAAALAIVGLLAARFVGRAWTAMRRARRPRSTNAIIFGAGEGGIQLIRQMRVDPGAGLRPVALLDDDPAKRRLRIAGIRVRGTRQHLAAVATRVRADICVIAIPSASSELIREIAGIAEGAGLRVMVLPPLEQLVRRRVGPGDLRDIDVNDLLGRRPVTLDESAIATEITARRVLVTGAGGSIGSELCRQIQRFGPERLYLLDRDESALHAVQLSLHGRALLDDDNTVLVDIRDRPALHEVFARLQPDVVFHAAALKHLPLLENYPLEAWKTNVVGTQNVLDAAASADVSTFVNISTDKAANPTSVLGYSKRIAERLTAGMATRDAGRYVSVRFGNVLGSRGSVLTTFERQIAEGSTITVTHPDVTRFFMTISEACQLVLQATAIGSDGEALVLDMGEPIRIVDVAETLIRMSGRADVQIDFTGLREGEKLHEELFAANELRDARPHHPLVSHVPVPILLSSDVSSSAALHESMVRDRLRVAATECADGGLVEHVVVDLPNART